MIPSATAPRSRFRQLWRTARHSPNSTTRLFAWAELVCFPVSLMALVLLVTTAILRAAEVALPVWWTRYTLPLLCTAAVGYLTNYLAVRMLFEPYSRRGHHWLRPVTFFLWKQGLIPARKQELGEAVGREISERLLTPKMITEEIARLVETEFDHPHFHERLRRRLPELVKAHLPAIIERMTPEVIAVMKESAESGLSAEKLTALFDGVIEPWLKVPTNRERLVTLLVSGIQRQTPRIVEFLQDAAQRFGERNLMSAFLVGFAEGAGAFEEEKLSQLINDQFRGPESRRQLAKAVDDFVDSIRRGFENPELDPSIDTFRTKASEYVVGLVHEQLTTQLPDKAARLMDNDEFWDWLSNEGFPSIKPAVLEWIQTDGLELIGKRFDVAGRVKRAVDEMDVQMVHQMVDNVATEQLGAIQVLGFVLGFVVGIPLVLFL